ncbi:MAG: VPLPA-CTERM sorting domain-containing protein [Pseudomonadota bacterium]
MRVNRYLIAATAAISFSSVSANAAVIDFESFDHGALISNGGFDIDGFSGTIETNSNGDFNIAQIYDSNVDGGADPDLEAPTNILTDEVYDGGNLVIISENNNANNPDDELAGGSITLMFDEAVLFTGITLVDAEPNGNEIDVQVDGGVFALQDIALGDGKWQTYDDFSFVTSEITVTFGGSGAFDALQVAEIPGPATALLLLTGMAGLVTLRGRRRALA